MINLKLAEYEGKKFERFLNQEDSEYFPPDWENFIIYMENGKEFNFENTKFLLGKDFVGFRYCIPYEGEALSVFKKDEKDPLNRFNGLFDGLTYGEGRFVLCESIGVKDKNQKDVWAFDIAKLKPFDSKLNYKLISNKKFLFGMGCMDGYVGCDGYGYDFTNVNFSESFDNDNADLRNEIVANLFENPELYEKLK